MTIVLVTNYLHMRETLLLLKGTLWPYKMLLEVVAHTLTTGKSGNDMDSRGFLGRLVVYSSIGLSVSPIVKQTAYLLTDRSCTFSLP